MKHYETKIQINIVEQHRIYFPHVLLTHPANQGRSPQEGAKLKKLGVRSGVSDLLLWWEGGSCAAIEIKADKGKESPNQVTFGFMLKRLGHKYGVVRSWEEYYRMLCGFGIKPIQECRIFKEANIMTWDEKVKLNFDMYKR